MTCELGVYSFANTPRTPVDAGIRTGAFAYRNGDLARLIGRPSSPLVEGLRPLV